MAIDRLLERIDQHDLRVDACFCIERIDTHLLGGMASRDYQLKPVSLRHPLTVGDEVPEIPA